MVTPAKARPRTPAAAGGGTVGDVVKWGAPQLRRQRLGPAGSAAARQAETRPVRPNRTAPHTAPRAPRRPSPSLITRRNKTKALFT